MRLIVQTHFVIVVFVGLLPPVHGQRSPGVFDSDEGQAIAAWVTKSELQRGELPEAVTSMGPLNKRQDVEVRDALWEIYQNAHQEGDGAAMLPVPTVTGTDNQPQVQAHKLQTGEKSMPFVFVERGTATGLKPMFIAIHGGGRGTVSTPHGWSVNTREWQTCFWLESSARSSADLG